METDMTTGQILGRLTAAAAFAMALAACATPQDATPLAAGEFGRAIVGADAAAHIETFDALDFDVFSNAKWDRLHESHADNVTVTWPDGHDTIGIDRHIDDLKAMFVYAPDTAIKTHPIRIAVGEWTAVSGVMTGTFTKRMPGPNGTLIQPTGKSFSLPMSTLSHWTNGKMDHEWLFWDNQTYMRQLGLAE
jgi:predicted ester cyclase